MKIIRNIQVPSKSHRIMLADLYCFDNNIKKPVILFVHGYKSFKDWGTFDLIARSFARKGFVFIKFNLSHNGTNQENPDQIVEKEAFGNNNIEIEVSDIKSMIDWIRFNQILMDYEFDKHKIYLVGHSRGATNSIIAAAESQWAKKLVCWSAFKNYEETWRRFYDFDVWENEGVLWRENRIDGQKLPIYYQLFENYKANENRFNLKKALAKVECPTMIIHGIEDGQIPYSEAIEMKQWNKKIELNLIPGATHNYGGYHPYNELHLPNDTQIIVEDTIEFLEED